MRQREKILVHMLYESWHRHRGRGSRATAGGHDEVPRCRDPRRRKRGPGAHGTSLPKSQGTKARGDYVAGVQGGEPGALGTAFRALTVTTRAEARAAASAACDGVYEDERCTSPGIRGC